MTPDFKASLKVGDQGVELLRTHWGWGGKLPSDTERRWDLETSVGHHEQVTVEVKTDTYDWRRTGNFFMEQHTNVAGGARLRGGPWRALEHGVDWFAYVYPNPTPRAWVFKDISILVDCIDDGTWQTRRVNPRGRLSATGLLVPRDAVCADYVVRGGRLLQLG